MSKRKFYKTTFKFVVLSESSTEGWTIADMIEACDSGPCVGDTEEFETVILTGKEMADALCNARSEPGFFELNDDGEDDDWEDEE